jgi:hypothetical protein
VKLWVGAWKAAHQKAQHRLAERVEQLTAGCLNVCFWHLADVQTALMNGRFEGNNGHGADLSVCPLMTESGHFGFLEA